MLMEYLRKSYKMLKVKQNLLEGSTSCIAKWFLKRRGMEIFSSNQKRFAIATLKQFYKSILDKLKLQFNNWYNEVKKYIEVLCPVCGDKLCMVTIYHNVPSVTE